MRRGAALETVVELEPEIKVFAEPKDGAVTLEMVSHEPVNPDVGNYWAAI